jgi:hypothetical protein
MLVSFFTHGAHKTRKKCETQKIEEIAKVSNLLSYYETQKTPNGRAHL